MKTVKVLNRLYRIWSDWLNRLHYRQCGVLFLHIECPTLFDLKDQFRINAINFDGIVFFFCTLYGQF